MQQAGNGKKGLAAGELMADYELRSTVIASKTGG
jgi:hypothetical protein